MRRHGWQLPYHPLQVVAVSVFLALGVAFYVFIAPFVGETLFQHIAIGIYTPLIVCSVSLYIWCTAADPADPGVFLKSKKHLKINSDGTTRNNKSSSDINASHYICSCSNVCEEQQQQRQANEDGMFYCNLCEVEVFKYSKHCRVCDKCVDQFDHHCRWLNNCVGKRNYHKFFTLIVSSLLLLILQWSTGILVLVNCFTKQNHFSSEITSKLGSSFSLLPFVVVVAVCTILAMVATLPLAQLLFFHILLIKKGISTYDYIIALREQDQQSPQMSPASSSITGLSSVSSLNNFHRAAWCTPPHMLLEDQFDVVSADTISVNSLGKNKMKMKKKGDSKRGAGSVKISPWALARLNAEDVVKAAADARKKSKILRPVDFVVQQQKQASINLESRLSLEISSPSVIAASSPDSCGMDSPPRLFGPFRGSTSSVANDARGLTGVSNCMMPAEEHISWSRSTSDGYEASGGEDSDQFPSTINLTNRQSVFDRDEIRLVSLRDLASSSHGHSRNNL
ncbi:probable protein S-acyltransferase 22 [Impatiens glandulifera]|uniref:probable protein S-acyltransferase 22 n=1 Tax=Impatiens glandulifera TaxID=253017 RepID=UPI001FB166E0|nr:probable protein S-acyltransferase 22 [Impatiens glandulifera]